MANEVLSKYGTSTAMTITIASLANTSSRESTAVIDASPAAPFYRIYFKVTTGTSPTSGKTFNFYVVTADDDGSEHRDGGTSGADASYTGDVEQLQFAYSQRVTGTSDTAYIGSFLIKEPGTDWGIVLENQTGVALNATGGNHYLRYRSLIPEVQ